MKNLADLVLTNSAIDPKAISLKDSGDQRTYLELAQRIRSVAHFLRSLGGRSGDRIALLLPNSCAFVEIQLGCSLADRVCVPINLRLLPNEQKNILEDAQVTVLFVHDCFSDRISDFRSALKNLQAVVLVKSDQGSNIVDTVDYDALFTLRIENSTLEINPNNDAIIFYTSGTTSTPKGVVLTHANLIANLNQYQEMVELPLGGVNLQLSPMFHVANFFCLIHLMRGGKTVFLDKIKPPFILNAIEREQVSFMYVVPTVLYEILDSPDLSSYNINSLQRLQYGAAPITGNRLAQTMQVFGQRLQHSYGMTECSGHASLLLGTEHQSHPGSVGRVLPGMDVRIVDDTNHDVAINEIGEIIIRGPNIFSGYWRQPKITLEILHDGWLHTGDLGRRDEQGFMYIVDRKKDIIISGGVNIYPTDIEDTLMHHPAVAECAIFGIPDDLWGEAVAAAVVLRENNKVDEITLMTYLRTQLAGYKLPKKLWILSTMPKNATGKILKRELQTKLNEGGIL